MKCSIFPTSLSALILEDTLTDGLVIYCGCISILRLDIKGVR